MGLIGLVFLLFSFRLFSIQVLSEEYARKADRYVIKSKSVIPPRGNIYNRYGEIFVSNRPMFNMLITRNELHIPDTSILRDYLGLTQQEIEERIAKAPRLKETVFARFIDPETFGALQEQLWGFKGITFTASNKRYYQTPVGANILGYISEVSPKEIKNSDGKYKSGDFIGKSGIERSHDTTLRGEQGLKKVLTNVHNRVVGSYANGKYDTKSIKGKDIMLGIDTELQQFGEELMHNKKGSIVAIEPSTGEILAFVSAPAYDPNMLTGKELRKNWRKLRNDTLNPLYNRPLMARYPPGSIFKLPVALAALNEGVITPDTYYSCGGGFKRNKGKPGCRYHAAMNLENAIKVSCNSYFAATYVDFLHHEKFGDFYEGYQKWFSYMKQMGIGRKLGVDIPYEVSGLLPTTQRYDKWYGESRWMATTVISNSIGQGEILMTPMQMANIASLIANRGKYLPPHFVRADRVSKDNDWERIPHDTVYTNIETRHYEMVIDAMEKVVASGTGGRARVDGYSVCGKTGTVENPHGKDHAVFLGFAPKHRPRIAIAVIIENAGGGGTWAAPTGGLMMEKYLKGEISSKKWEYQRVKNKSFIKGK